MFSSFSCLLLLDQSSTDTELKEREWFWFLSLFLFLFFCLFWGVFFDSFDPKVNKQRITTMRKLELLLYEHSGECYMDFLGSRSKEVDYVDCGSFLYLKNNYFSTDFLWSL